MSIHECMGIGCVTLHRYMWTDIRMLAEKKLSGGAYIRWDKRFLNIVANIKYRKNWPAIIPTFSIVVEQLNKLMYSA
jgi:hypothetical protein